LPKITTLLGKDLRDGIQKTGRSRAKNEVRFLESDIGTYIVLKFSKSSRPVV
jgi:hypothetical protein